VANIKSAKKRAKQTVVRNARNVAQRSMLRTAVKKVIKALKPPSPLPSRSWIVSARVA
jgi:ribosomal protein S20